MKLYRYSVGTNVFEDGLTVFPVAGESVDVDGKRMVRLGPDTIHAADGWHESQAAAIEDAAARIERTAILLLKQAVRLLQSAKEAAS